MAKHQVDYEHAKDFTFKHSFAGLYGRGNNKDLFCVVEPPHKEACFVVLDHGKEVFRGELKDAIKHYNNV